MEKDLKGIISQVKDKVEDAKSSKPIDSFKLDYLGGHPDITKQKKCTLDIYPLYIEIGIGKNIARVLMSDIKSVNFETPQQIEKRVTATRLLALGVFAFAFKKKSKSKDKFLTVDFLFSGLENTMMFEGSQAPKAHSSLINIYAKYKQKHQDTDSNVSVNADDSIAKVKKLKELLDIGAITKEEFENKKKDILGL